MSLGASGIQDGQWVAVVCPNPACHMMLVRLSNWKLEGCMEHWCPHCHRRSIHGGPDLENPPRPQVLIVKTKDGYRDYRRRADSRWKYERRFSVPAT